MWFRLALVGCLGVALLFPWGASLAQPEPAEQAPAPVTEPAPAIIQPPAAATPGVPATPAAPRPAAPTPPAEALPTAKLSFAVLGNCRPGLVGGCSPVLQRIAMILGQQRPDLVLGTGDYIEGSLDPTALERQYQWLFYALAPLQDWGQVPVAFAPGGREIKGSAANARLFARYFGGLYYSFDRGAAHFIVLNTEVPGQEQRIMGDQWWWLVSDLYQALGSRFIFVVMNRPLFPVASMRGQSLDRYPQYRDTLHRLFRDYRVSAVFAGAEALYDYQERDGVHYFITGGAGAPLDTTAPTPAYHHYLWVSCTERGFTVEVKPVG